MTSISSTEPVVNPAPRPHIYSLEEDWHPPLAIDYVRPSVIERTMRGLTRIRLHKPTWKALSWRDKLFFVHMAEMAMSYEGYEFRWDVADRQAIRSKAFCFFMDWQESGQSHLTAGSEAAHE